MDPGFESGEVHNDVLIGLDEYLFLFGGSHRQFSYLTGQSKPTQEHVNNFFNNIDVRHEFCVSRRIDYIHVVFPSKPVVITNKLPESWRSRVNSLFLTEYVKNSTQRLPNHLFYPREQLLELGNRKRTFKVLDTHLTDAGSLSVALNILERLELTYDPSDYFYDTNEQLSGDLARMLNSQKRVSEVRVKPFKEPAIFDNRHALRSNGNNVCIYYNSSAKSNRRLLVFGDSFARDILLYLSPAFRSIVYVRSASFQGDMVELFGPDVVITSNTERYLAKVDSDSISSPMIFALYGSDHYHPSKSFIDALKAEFSWKHHRNSYSSWESLINENVLSWGGLGLCKPNSQTLELDKNSLLFRSSGTDPQLLFPNSDLGNLDNFILEIEMISDVASTACLYYTMINGYSKFCEENIIRVPVKPGVYKIRFIFDNLKINNSVRLDPIACTGNFKFTKISISPL